MQKVKCDECGEEYEISLHTRPLPFPFEMTVEVYLECVYCFYQKITHFISPDMVKKKLELDRMIERWHKNKTRVNFNRVVTARKEYSKLFDEEQEKYRKFLTLDKVENSNGR